MSAAASSSGTCAVLFDLGGVLVGLRGFDYLRQQLGIGQHWDMLALQRHFETDEAMWRYECGQMTTGEYLDHLRRTFRISIGDAELCSIINRVLTGPRIGIETLLSELARRHPLYLLSNTNELHWQVILTYPIMRHFRQLFASHLIGCRKPDPQAYRHVLNIVGLSPEQLLFIDDYPPNVSAATAVGIPAFVFESTQQVRRELGSRGLL